MRKIVCVILVLVNILVANAQIINIENKRIYDDSAKFSGKLKFKVMGIKNTVETFDFGNSIYLQYKKNNYKWLLLTDINYISVDSIVSDNSGFAHLRYTNKLSEEIALELFTQAQFNKAMHVDLRALVGGGFRLTAINSGNTNLFYGLSCFYEHEENQTDNETFDLGRLSTYLTYHILIGESTEISNTTYFQPVINNMTDQRIFNELSITLQIVKKLSFEASYYILYDSNSPKNIPNTNWKYENKLSLSF